VLLVGHSDSNRHLDFGSQRLQVNSTADGAFLG